MKKRNPAVYPSLQREGTISPDEAHLWRERYRVLFDRNVAGIILTKVDGRIVDCNEPYARILGFDSSHEVLAHSVWDFYFHRAERTAFIDRLRSEGYCPAEEVCLRGRDGVPVWVLATCAVAGVTHGQPDLLLGTVIDITTWKTTQAASLCNIKDTKVAARHESSEITNLSHRLAILLQQASRTLQPDNLPRMGRPEIKEFMIVLEEMKMLMSQLEVLHLLSNS